MHLTCYLVEHVDGQRTLRGLILHFSERTHLKIAKENTRLRRLTAVRGTSNGLSIKLNTKID